MSVLHSTRAKLAVLEDAVESLRAAYGYDIIRLIDEPNMSLQLGDMLYMPEGEQADVTLDLWEVVMILNCFADAFRERLHALEAA